MPIIRCKNQTFTKSQLKDCGRFFAVLPQIVLTVLKDYPQNRIILRCHDCPPDQRWIAIYYDTDTGFTWDICDEQEVKKLLDDDNELVFDTVIKSTIGG